MYCLNGPGNLSGMTRRSHLLSNDGTWTMEFCNFSSSTWLFGCLMTREALDLCPILAYNILDMITTDSSIIFYHLQVEKSDKCETRASPSYTRAEGSCQRVELSYEGRSVTGVSSLRSGTSSHELVDWGPTLGISLKQDLFNFNPSLLIMLYIAGSGVSSSLPSLGVEVWLKEIRQSWLQNLILDDICKFQNPWNRCKLPIFLLV